MAGLGLAGLCFATDFDPFEGPEPLLVIVDFNPWGMVINADSPRVAIYRNGDMVFLDDNRKDPGYRIKRLTTEDRERLLKSARSVFLSQGLKHRYDIRSGTDRPMTKFYFRDGGSSVATEVYGLECNPSKPFPWERDLETAPKALLDLNASLCTLPSEGSEKWSPRYVEVMVWGYEYAKGASVPWPKDWPGLDSPRAMKRGDAYSIFMDASVMPQLQAFLSQIREKSAVVIDGKKMSVSYRMPFPSEPVWRRAFESIEQ